MILSKILALYDFKSIDELLEFMEPVIQGVVRRAPPNKREDARQDTILAMLEALERRPSYNWKNYTWKWVGFDPDQGSLFRYLESVAWGGLAAHRAESEEPTVSFSDLGDPDEEDEAEDYDTILGRHVDDLSRLSEVWYEEHPPKDDEPEVFHVHRVYRIVEQTTYRRQAKPWPIIYPVEAKLVLQFLHPRGELGMIDLEEEHTWERFDDSRPDREAAWKPEAGQGEPLTTVYRSIGTPEYIGFRGKRKVRLMTRPVLLHARRVYREPPALHRDVFKNLPAKRSVVPVEPFGPDKDLNVLANWITEDDVEFLQAAQEAGLSANEIQDALLAKDLHEAGLLRGLEPDWIRAKGKVAYERARNWKEKRAMDRLPNRLRAGGVVTKNGLFYQWHQIVGAIQDGRLVCSHTRLCSRIQERFALNPAAMAVVEALEIKEDADGG